MAIEPAWFKTLGIGSSAVDSSSMLDINSTAKGARPFPSMTEAQRDAIGTPATGLSVFNTTSNLLNQYNGSSWIAIGGSPLLGSVAKTANYTVTTSDNVLFGDSSGGAFTFTMMTEASGAGIIFTFQKTTSDFTAITINNDAAGAITTINTEGEAVRIFSDGTTWHILDRYIPKVINTFTPSWTGLTLNNGTQTASWFRDGRYMEGVIELVFGSTTAISASVSFTVPDSRVVDTTYERIAFGGYGGSLIMENSGSTIVDGHVYPSNTTTLVLIKMQSAAAFLSSTVPFTWAINDSIFIKFKVAITGWE